MIDEKINNSLKELEQSLQHIESARKQVESTVNSYEDLNNSTSRYVTTLSSLTAKVNELITTIGDDYDHKIATFEKDRKTIIDTANATTQKLSDTIDVFQSKLDNVESKLKISLALNAVAIIIAAVIVYLVLK